MHLNGSRQLLTWWPRSRHLKHLPRAQRLKAILRSRPSSRSNDDGSRPGRPPRPTFTQPSPYPRAAGAAERPPQGSVGAPSTWHKSAVPRTSLETELVVEVNSNCGANSPLSSSSSKPKEATHSKLGAGRLSSPGRGTLAWPPETTDGNDKDPSPSTSTAGS
jgi:hypothetical protein